jgi:hypothetical protein
VEYQRIGAWRHVPAVSTERVPFGVPGPGTLAGMNRRVVFGTLLGPEATGPGFWLRDLCFWFPGCTDHARWLFLRVRLVCGVCGTGLLFENYIVDASIFYKKQFPRI